jgi:hypothetical protein
MRAGDLDDVGLFRRAMAQRQHAGPKAIAIARVGNQKPRSANAAARRCAVLFVSPSLSASSVAVNGPSATASSTSSPRISVCAPPDVVVSGIASGALWLVVDVIVPIF